MEDATKVSSARSFSYHSRLHSTSVHMMSHTISSSSLGEVEMATIGPNTLTDRPLELILCSKVPFRFHIGLDWL